MEQLSNSVKTENPLVDFPSQRDRTFIYKFTKFMFNMNTIITSVTSSKKYK